MCWCSFRFCWELMPFCYMHKGFLLRWSRSWISPSFSSNQYWCLCEVWPIVSVQALWVADLSTPHCCCSTLASAEERSRSQVERHSWNFFWGGLWGLWCWTSSSWSLYVYGLCKHGICPWLIDGYFAVIYTSNFFPEPTRSTLLKLSG